MGEQGAQQAGAPVPGHCTVLHILDSKKVKQYLQSVSTFMAEVSRDTVVFVIG
jgi:hypothetical protein